MTQHTWSIDLAKKVAQKIAAASSGDTFCRELPQAGNENALLEIIGPDGKRIFSRPVFLNTGLHFDYLEGDKLKGGKKKLGTVVFSSLVPDDVPTGSRMRLSSLKEPRDLIGEGGA